MCDPIDSSPPGSAIPGIPQARTLEWVAISFSNAWKWKVKVNSLSRVWLFETPWTAAYQAPPSMGFSRQEYWSGLPLPSPLASSTRDQTFVPCSEAQGFNHWTTREIPYENIYTHICSVVVQAVICLQFGRPGFDPWVGKICLENPHGQRSLEGYSPRDHKESDTTEWLSAAQRHGFWLRQAELLGIEVSWPRPCCLGFLSHLVDVWCPEADFVLAVNTELTVF